MSSFSLTILAAILCCGVVHCFDPGEAHAVCLLPPLSGHCQSAQSRYYYNAFTSQCSVFPYSGCGGNSNNFQDQDACMKTCGPKQIAPTLRTGQGSPSKLLNALIG